MPSDSIEPVIDKVAKIKTIKKLGSASIGVAIIVFICLIFMYFSLQKISLSKIEPYQVHIQLSKESENQILSTTNSKLDLSIDKNIKQHRIQVDYDYGFGFNAEHQQIIVIGAILPDREMSLSISAWKPLRAIRFTLLNPKKEHPHSILVSSLLLRKGEIAYSVISTEQRLGSKDLILVENIEKKLLGIH